MDAVQEPVVRVSHRPVHADDAEGENSHHQQAGKQFPVPGQVCDDKQYREGSQQEIQQGGRDDGDAVSEKGGTDADDGQGAEQRQQDRHQRAGHGVGVAEEDQQQDRRDKGQRVTDGRQVFRKRRRRELDGCEQQREKEAARGRKVEELRQEPAAPVGQPAGNRQGFGQIAPRKLEELELLLVVYVVGVSQPEEEESGHGEKAREQAVI